MVAVLEAPPSDQAASCARLEARHAVDARKQKVEIAHYAAIRQYHASLLDAYIPRYRRLTQLHFGRIVSNPDAPQAFSDNVGFNMTYNLVEPGKGNALHTHPSVEVFIPLDGQWEIAWGEKGENKLLLQPWDMIAVPAHVRHSYRNAEKQTAHNIMTILPGKAAITWAPEVVTEAREHGALCTNRGQLLDFWKGEGGAKQPGCLVYDTDEEDEPDAYHLPMSAPEMTRHLRRFADRRPLLVRAEQSRLEVGWHTLAQGEELCADATAVDHLLVVLEGSLMLCRADGGVFAAVTRLDSVRVPAEEAGRITAVNQLEEPCTFLLVESRMRGLVDGASDAWRIGEDEAETKMTPPPAKSRRVVGADVALAPVVSLEGM